MAVVMIAISAFPCAGADSPRGADTAALSKCHCPHQGDMNADGTIDALDASYLIDYVFFGGPRPPRDPDCPLADRGDVTCDGTVNVLDVMRLRDHIFRRGAAPCDPCGGRR
jgi:hypothetical protein